MSERRRPYYLITGLVLGLLLGMLYARAINPPVLVNLTPGRLNPVDQDQYRLMIALAFQADGDLGRAIARLDLLGDNPLADLATQAQRMLAGGGSMEDARALALLAQALAQPSVPVATLEPSPTETPSPTITPELPTLTPSPTLDLAAVVHSPTPSRTPLREASPSISPTGAATYTPRPTNTPQPTAGAPFLPVESKAVCDVPGAAGRLLVEVQNAAGTPVAGVRIVVSWPGGQDDFFTGLHPQIDDGYADFSMSEGVIYSIRAGEGGQAAAGISTSGCGAGVLGGWSVLFQQP